jgi:hypothetical protein
VVPHAREFDFIKPLLSGKKLIPQTTSTLGSNDLMRLASEAEAINPGIIGEVTNRFSRRPMVLTKLDRNSQGMILMTQARAKTGGVESRFTGRALSEMLLGPR